MSLQAANLKTKKGQAFAALQSIKWWDGVLGPRSLVPNRPCYYPLTSTSLGSAMNPFMQRAKTKSSQTIFLIGCPMGFSRAYGFAGARFAEMAKTWTRWTSRAVRSSSFNLALETTQGKNKRAEIFQPGQQFYVAKSALTNPDFFLLNDFFIFRSWGDAPSSVYLHRQPARLNLKIDSHEAMLRCSTFGPFQHSGHSGASHVIPSMPLSVFRVVWLLPAFSWLCCVWFCFLCLASSLHEQFNPVVTLLGTSWRKPKAFGSGLGWALIWFWLISFDLLWLCLILRLFFEVWCWCFLIFLGIKFELIWVDLERIGLNCIWCMFVGMIWSHVIGFEVWFD